MSDEHQNIGGDWEKILDYTTPYTSLPAIAARLAAPSLDNLREQLAADDSLTDLERIRMLDKARPLILELTRSDLEKGWLGLHSTRPM
jgi:hypothetical protein